jgi:hypothetical protein
VDKWFYAGWATRQNNLRLPAYMGGRSGTSVQRAVLQKWDDAAGSAGAAFPIAPVILLSKLLKPALPNGTTNNLYNKLLVRPDEYQELPHHLITRIIKAHESTASGLASQTMG